MIDPSFYILDAQGNTMAIYEHTNNGRTPEFLTERKLSGSSRLDQERVNELMSFRTLNQTVTPSVSFTSTNYGGATQYELASHLGNVLDVITDGKLPSDHPTDLGTTENYTADVVSYPDYYPFGMILPNRNGQESSAEYRYGVNGMETDDEIKNQKGTSYDFGARLYDPRVGRWLTIDPAFKEYNSLAPFTFTGNNPIMYVELDGKVFDLGYLSDEQRNAYLKKVNYLRENSKMFDYYYSILDNSKTRYTVDGNVPIQTEGAYASEFNYVMFKDIINVGENVIVQELFHAFQDELFTEGKAYLGTETRPASNIELEGDLMTIYVSQEYGGVVTTYGWEGEMKKYYADELSVEVLNSDEYLHNYSEALDDRIEFYQIKASSPDSKRDYSTYTAPRQEFGPECILKVVKELEAKSGKIEGPRLENGDYYED